MREFIGLFRGKRIDNGEWVEGYLLRSKIKERIHYEIYIPFTEEEEKENEGHFLSAVGGIWREVDPDTVGECTGLKDKNDELIFEGDVVLYPWKDRGNPERFVIKFKDGCFVASPVKGTDDYWDFMVGGYSKKMEIIGNIHDNPELLKGGES